MHLAERNESVVAGSCAALFAAEPAGCSSASISAKHNHLCFSSHSPQAEEERKANPAMGACHSLLTDTITGGNERIKYAVSSTQGMRRQMEDKYAAILDLNPTDHDSTSFFGVFDGYRGPNVASRCATQFPIYLLENQDLYNNDPGQAMQDVCLRIDRELQQLPNPTANAHWKKDLKIFVRDKVLRQKHNEGIAALDRPFGTEGSTACMALIRGHQIIVGNVGNSHCILSRNGQAIDLGRRHVPNDLVTEMGRILNATGGVRDSRLFGKLSISRAFGLFAFKSDETRAREEQVMICDPDILLETITQDTEFLFIATDGVWNVMTSQEVVDYIRRALRSKAEGTADLGAICERLIFRCLRSRDNATAILVEFLANSRQPAPPLGVQGHPAAHLQGQQ